MSYRLFGWKNGLRRALSLRSFRGTTKNIVIQFVKATRIKWIAACLALPLIYLFGGYSASRNIFPFPILRAVKAYIVLPPPTVRKPDPPQRFSFDKTGRLTSDLQKTRVACPLQNDSMAVLLVIGQSNAGNHAGQRFRSEHGAAILNFFDGQCFIAASPLLGSTGTNGEYWTLLANLLVSSQAFDRVVLVPVSVGGTEVARWARGGDLNALLVNAAVDLRSHNYRATHVLWHQGESDLAYGTSERQYAARFLSVVDTLRAQYITAPIFVSVASKCLLLTTFSPTNAVVLAQLSLPNSKQQIIGGVNSDAILDEMDRYDDCHFSATGQNKIAAAWAQIIMKNSPRKSGFR